MKRVKVSNNVIRRLPRYLRKLDELTDAGVSRISSGELGRQLGLTPLADPSGLQLLRRVRPAGLRL